MSLVVNSGTWNLFSGGGGGGAHQLANNTISEKNHKMTSELDSRQNNENC